MKSEVLKRGYLINRIVFGLILYSLGVLVLALVFGYHKPPGHPPSLEHLNVLRNIDGDVPEYRSYFQKWNWSLYPLFFVIIGFVLHRSWNPFQKAWANASTSDKTVVRGQAESQPITAHQSKLLTRKMHRIRHYGLIFGLLASGIWSYFDTQETVIAYKADTYIEQLEVALIDPDFTVKWLFDVPPEDYGAPIGATSNQLFFTILIELEQLFLIALGWMVFFQIALQTYTFVSLGSYNIDGKRFRIELNTQALSHDFGLGDWNVAIDKMYWALTVGLVMPVISMLSQPFGKKDVGQLMGIWAMAILMLTPYLITVIGRKRWLEDARARMKGITDPEKWDLFREQHLWPMNPRQLEKIGLHLCMSLYGLFAGIKSLEVLQSFTIL